MTRVVVVALIAAQLLDVLTRSLMPRWAEANPLVHGMDTPTGWAVKGALLVLVFAVQPALRPKYRVIGDVLLVLALMVGSAGAGSNLSVLAATKAPRPALHVPATASAPSSEAVGRTPAPSGVGGSPPLPMVMDASRSVAPRAVGRSLSVPALTGRASWYRVDGLVAAAGPRLRAALGPGWRGALVTVCASACVRVRLVDWCACYRGTRGERLIDLSPEAFAKLAPLASGIVRVRVALLVVLVVAIQPALRPRYPAVGEAVALLALAAGCIGAGSNIAVLSSVAS